MWDWLTYFALPDIVVSFLIIAGVLSISYLAIRAFLSIFTPSKSHLAGHYFSYFWVASALAIVGFLISELGYQMNYWEAPGIWGQPGKDSTLWGVFQYMFPIQGLALGIVLNAILEHRLRSKARSVRVAIAVVTALLWIMTLMLSAWHAMQTLG